MKPATFEIVDNKPGQTLVIRDVGHSYGCLTVTNDAEGVVRRLHGGNLLTPGRRLFYFDSEDRLGELLHDGKGHFTGFNPHPL